MTSPHLNHAGCGRARSPASNRATPGTIWPSVQIPTPRRSIRQATVRSAARTSPTQRCPGSSAARCSTCRRSRSFARNTKPSGGAVAVGQRRPGPSQPPDPYQAEPTAPPCCGPALRAYVCYLVTRQHIPVARVAEQLRDAYGAPISTATIIAMVKEGAAMLEEFLIQVRVLLRDADVVHADETGLRVEAALAWVHAVSTGDLTLYHLDTKRGTDAMDAMGVIEHLRGVLVHDGWSSYRSYENLTHQLCNSHHLRELEAAGSTEGQSWATDMATLLSATWQRVLEAKAAGQRSLSDEVLAEVCENYKSIIAAGHVATPPVAPSGKRGRTKRSKAHNLLLRLDVYEDDVLRFATDFAVPFDNNLCERDVRMVKIAQKISGGFRSTEGAEAFLALRSYLSTAAKQGMNRLEALQRLFNGDTWMPAAPGASP